jgi:ORF6N domain
MKTKTPQDDSHFPSPPMERIDRTTLLIRGQRVILDANLAALYRVTTKAFNQAVKRNRDRFPSDFTFRLTPGEKLEVVTNCDHLRKLKFSPVLPLAFTEHGATMAATGLSSPRAIAVSVNVVRAFIRLRQAMINHHEFANKLADLEKKLIEHDERFAEVFHAIHELMQPAPVPAKRRIGFSTSEEKQS